MDKSDYQFGKEAGRREVLEEVKEMNESRYGHMKDTCESQEYDAVSRILKDLGAKSDACSTKSEEDVAREIFDDIEKLTVLNMKAPLMPAPNGTIVANNDYHDLKEKWCKYLKKSKLFKKHKAKEKIFYNVRAAMNYLQKEAKKGETIIIEEAATTTHPRRVHRFIKRSDAEEHKVVGGKDEGKD